MQESQTEKEEMRQQQRMKIRTDMTRKIKSKVRMDAKKQLVVGVRNGSGSGNACPAPAPGSRERPHGARNFPPPGRRGLHYMRRVTPRGSNRKLRRHCPGNPHKLGIEVLKRMAKREPPRPGQE